MHSYWGIMYFAAVVLLLLVLPAGSIVLEAVARGSGIDAGLIGKWFVFWAVGVRLLIAGVRQVARPQFTAEDIFIVKDTTALAIVREVGFGNIAMGILGLATLLRPDWLVPAAIVGGLYYGLAGAGHAVRGNLNAAGWTALISDFFILIVLAGFAVVHGL